MSGSPVSREQRDHARRRLFKAGLSDRAQIHLRDYRDQRRAYDGVASIEMIDAVGEKYWPEYFRALRDRLRPGSVAALQAITIADRLFPQYRTRADFIQKHIFPGGIMPCPAALREQSEAAGLETVAKDTFANGYSRTLREWRRRFNSSRDRIATLGFDDRFHRL